MEIWKDIIGYEGLYQVSNLGNIKRISGSAMCLKDRVLIIKTKPNGYCFVCLSKNNSLKYPHIHRLVAIAFIANPENKSQVNHINGIKKDNRLENLEWVTPSENGLHSFRELGRVGVGLKGLLNKKSKPIVQKTISGEIIKQYESINIASKENSFSNTLISNVAKNKYGNKTAYGFKWEFANI